MRDSLPKDIRKELLKQMDNVNFKTIVSRRIAPLAADLLGSPHRDDRYFREVLWGLEGNTHRNFAVIGNAIVYDTAYMSRNTDSVIDHTRGDPKALEDFARKGKRLGTDLEELSLRIRGADLSSKSKAELAGLFSKFLEKFSLMAVYLGLAVSIEGYLQKRIREGLTDIVGEKEIDPTMIALTAPVEHDILHNEHKDLLNIAVKYHSGGDVNGDIERHIYNFGNVGIRWGIGDPWSEQELLERVKDTKDAKQQLRELEEADMKAKQELQMFEKEHPDRKGLVADIKVAKWYVWLRTYRAEALNGAIVNIYPLLNEMARRMGLGLDDIKQFNIDEVLSGKPISKGEIERRKEAFVLLQLSGSRYYFSGDDAKYFIDYWERKQALAGGIRGTVASAPVDTIVGAVRIIKTVKEMRKVNAGDILVAPMTQPNFVPAMEKASAFVTDEGGITCHAAIVAREMRKPCIIGTGNATRMLKDGDMVRLDLKAGTVSRLTKPDMPQAHR